MTTPTVPGLERAVRFCTGLIVLGLAFIAGGVALGSFFSGPAGAGVVGSGLGTGSLLVTVGARERTRAQAALAQLCESSDSMSPAHLFGRDDRSPFAGLYRWLTRMAVFGGFQLVAGLVVGVLAPGLFAVALVGTGALCVAVGLRQRRWAKTMIDRRTGSGGIAVDVDRPET